MQRTEEVIDSPNTPEPDLARVRTPRWVIVLVGGLVALAVLAVAAWGLSLPYLTFSPGPLQGVNDLITLAGEQAPHQESELYMLTVSIGTQPVNVFEFVTAQLDGAVDLIDRDLVRPADISHEEYVEQNRNLMEESKNLAIFVALDHLGYDVRFTGDGMIVRSIIEDSPADGALELDDVIVAIEGEPVRLASDGVSVIQSHGIGETIELTVIRAEKDTTVEVTLIEHVSNPGVAMVGFSAETANLAYEFPIEVDIDSTNIGGPSAGLVYTLGVINSLTDEDIMKGYLVAGTGTIQEDGEVGPIGGVRQKVVSAEAAGVDIMFIPIENHTEALTADFENLQLVAVESLDDALAFLAFLPSA